MRRRHIFRHQADSANIAQNESAESTLCGYILQKYVYFGKKIKMINCSNNKITMLIFIHTHIHTHTPFNSRTHAEIIQFNSEYEWYLL